MKTAFITNLCTHYRYKIFKMLGNKHDYDFYFFDSEGKTKEDIKHLNVIKEGKRFHYLSIKKILINIIKKKYDVIIKCTNNKWAFLGSFIAAKLIKARFIVWHTIWYYPKTIQYRLFSQLLLYILKKHTDAIVVYGKHGKNFLIKKGINPAKIFIAWQTVDNELFGRDIDDEEITFIRNKYEISESKKVILYVGRFEKIKGIEYLLEALDMLDKREFVLLLIGDGSLSGQIRNYCEKNGIDYRITGLMPHYELPPYYKMADVFVLPSITTKKLKETWGLVVNEAFNQRCPAVVTDAVGAGVGGLLIDGVNGFVIKEKDANALADSLRKVISDTQLRNKLSRNAREDIKKWTYERQAEGFLNAVKLSIEGTVKDPNDF
ncbi:MAG: glycosyltransferase family 4 protein [Candidatus Hodarchaeota archaeon]